MSGAEFHLLREVSELHVTVHSETALERQSVSFVMTRLREVVDFLKPLNAGLAYVFPQSTNHGARLGLSLGNRTNTPMVVTP